MKKPTAIFCSILAVLMTTSGHYAFAQTDSRPVERAKYVRTVALPDEMFLRQFLKVTTKHDTGHDKVDAVLLLQHKIGFSDYMSAEEFYDYLALMKIQMNADHRALTRSQLCPFDSPRPSGAEVFAIMDMLDDRWENFGHKYLGKIRGRLSQGQKSNLNEWMNELKLRTTVIKLDHAKRYENDNADVVRQRVCGTFDSQSSVD